MSNPSTSATHLMMGMELLVRISVTSFPPFIMAADRAAFFPAVLCFRRLYPQCRTACTNGRIILLSGHGIISPVRKRIAPQDSPKRKKTALQRSVALYCFQTILGTGRRIRAPISLVRGNVLLIKADRPDHDSLKHVSSFSGSRAAASFSMECSSPA